MLDDKRLAEIRERAERATHAPWRAENGGLYVPNEWDGNLLDADDDGLNPKFCEEEDARFCARAREDIPALLAEVERLADANEQLIEALAQTIRGRDNAEAENARLARELGAAKNDLAHECYTCKHFRDNDGKCPLWGTKCRELGWKAFLGLGDAPPYEWEWRGICPANTPDAREGGTTECSEV